MSTLLVIDRNRRSLHWLSRSLAPQCRIVAVPNVFTAFRLLRRRRFDAIIVKSAHHDAYALAVLKWLTQQNVECPVVVLLGSGTAGDAALARKYGASAILRWRPSERSLVRSVSEATAAPASNNGHHRAGVGRAAAEPLETRFRDDHARQWFFSEHRTSRFG